MSKRKALFKNTVMLYILTFSTYIINFILIPYETRVLLPEKFGLLGAVTATMTYFQLVIDFGFLLSATEEVSTEREDKKRVSVIFTSVTLSKIMLSLLSFLIMYSLFYFFPQWGQNKKFFILMFISMMIYSFIPDYLYRGIEKMGAITARTLCIKLFFSLMIFIFVKKPDDYIRIPIINMVGNAVALIGVYIHLFFKLDICFCRCSVKDIYIRIRKAVTFFWSRMATTVYTVSNTIIIDLFFGNTMTAYYTAANKFINVAKSGMYPISDSLYPYMIKNRDFKIIKKILLLLEPIIILGCTILFIFAEPLCSWFFGEEYRNSASALRALLPLVVFTFPNYILGFPVLGALGLSHHANYAIIFASSLHVINLVILYLSGCLNMVTLGIAASVAEGLILVYQVSVIVIYLKKTRAGRNEN